MYHRNAAFDSVVAVVVKEICGANGCGHARYFNCGKLSVIIDNRVAKKAFVYASSALVQCRREIEGSRSCDAGKEQIILEVPKWMGWRFWFC